MASESPRLKLAKLILHSNSCHDSSSYCTHLDYCLSQSKFQLQTIKPISVKFSIEGLKKELSGEVHFGPYGWSYENE
jgi:hypothetical protein